MKREISIQPANFHTLAHRLRLLRKKLSSHTTQHTIKRMSCGHGADSMRQAVTAWCFGSRQHCIEVSSVRITFGNNEQRPGTNSSWKLKFWFFSVVCVTSYHQYTVTCHWLLLHASLGILWCLDLVPALLSGKKTASSPKTCPLHPTKLDDTWYVNILGVFPSDTQKISWKTDPNKHTIQPEIVWKPSTLPPPQAAVKPTYLFFWLVRMVDRRPTWRDLK